MNDRPLPVGEHLIELRRRVIWSAAAVLVCTGAAFAFHEQILVLLMKPAQGFAGTPNEKPFVLFQAVMFVAPGLSSQERRYLYALMPVIILVFLAGAAFGYFVLFPPAVRFLQTFGSDVATPFISISKYVNLMISLLFWMGVVFETPVVLFFLAKIGIVSPSFLARQRRWAIVVAFILGAMITPTFDPINQTLVALPIIVLYEAGVWLAKLARRQRRGDSEQPESLG